MSKYLHSKEIDRYLSGRMPPEEKAAFEEKMAGDPDLAQEVQNREAERKTIRMLVKQEYREKIKQWTPPIDDLVKELAAEEEKVLEQQKESPTQKHKVFPKISGLRIRRLYYRLAGAAAIIALVVAGYLLFKPSENQQLFQEHHFAFEDKISSELGSPGLFQTNQHLDVLEQAMASYNQENYAQAVREFDVFLNRSDDPYWDPYAEFYKAQSLLASRQFKAALPILQNLTEDEKFLLKTDIQWYLALTHLRLGNKEEARKGFEALSTDKDYERRAKEVLEGM